MSRCYTKIQLYEQFNISRPTVGKWIKRHEQVGFDDLSEHSRRPLHSPNATQQWIVEWLIAERLKRPDWEAKKLLDYFALSHLSVKRPADSTGDLILACAGLLEPRKSKRRVSANSRSPLVIALKPMQFGVRILKANLHSLTNSFAIKWQGKTYYLSQVLANEPIAFGPYADGIWRIYYRFLLLGEFHEREQKIEPLTQWHANSM
ncbi:hypothetical protein [Pasteurella multocida]|uniref:hypothetical protein n=1 Tax=Pasteurella multocida TaxID=747 RepID=UPI003978D0A4